MVLGVVLAVLSVVGYAAHRVSRWAGERGWVYNKYNPRPPGRRTLGSLEQIFQPTIEYVIDQQSSEQTRAIQDESSDKPDAGFPSTNA